jgi:hypothetical protein
MDSPDLTNYLFQPVEYKYEETAWGVWRSHLNQNGRLFREFVSHGRLFGLPLIHYTSGVCPETGRRIVAMGIIAIGRVAVGGLAIGHASFGLIAIGQLAIGLALGLGQASTGAIAVGQAALGVFFGLGQLATGYVAIGQLSLGHYVLAQLGMGRHVWDVRAADPVAKQFFGWLLGL